MEPNRERLGLDAEIGEEARGIADALLLEHEELIGRDRVERQPVERARHGLDRAQRHGRLPSARARWPRAGALARSLRPPAPPGSVALGTARCPAPGRWARA